MVKREPEASAFVPDGEAVESALRRCTHVGIGAHQDDLEIMAYHGIAQCFGDESLWFGGITCTDGAGSPRAGAFGDFSDEQMKELRHHEQEEAARMGKYGVMMQLRYPSATVKGDGREALEDDLVEVLGKMSPQVVYTHNLADRHETHVAVALAAVRAIRRLPDTTRPHKVYGCETWRDLDWMLDDDVVVLDVSSRPELAERLIGVFGSQIAGGKHYDLAAMGRRLSNATFRASHAVDRVEQAWLAMDLTPLVVVDSLDVEHYIDVLMGRFSDDVCERLRRHARPREGD